MDLSEAQKKHLRRLGHKLKAVVMIGGAGLSPAVYKELDSALEHHELVKVSVRVGDRQLRDQVIAELCAKNAASLVQRVGNVALLYRRNPDKPRVRLPAA